jgi:hypothetical protein
MASCKPEMVPCCEPYSLDGFWPPVSARFSPGILKPDTNRRSAAAILTALILLGIGLSNDRVSGSFKEWSFGAASINYGIEYVISGFGVYQYDRLIQNVLLANTPQLIISFLFLL